MSKQSDNGKSPATKADIAKVIAYSDKKYAELRRDIGELREENKQWKDEILESNKKWKDEIIRHFDVVAENLYSDFKGIFKDRTEQHTDSIIDLKKRVTIIEHHVGLAV